MKIKFDKIAKTSDEHISILKKRGMSFQDETKAKFLFDYISYYRLSGYWFHKYIDMETKQFLPNTSFEDAFALYCFDKDLRRLLVSELEKIEVAVRATIINNFSLAYGPYWFIQKELFNSSLSKIKSSFKRYFERSDELFINHFKNKYSDEMPPSWIILEVSSFGSLSTLYKDFIYNIEKREIANKFKLQDKVFESWLHTFVYVRNVCAHHSRLWNRRISVSPTIPKKPKTTWLSNKINHKSSYFIIVITAYMLKTINPSTTFKQKLINLFTKYPNVDITQMGMNTDWLNEPFWQELK